jgi:hypothetical protein
VNCLANQAQLFRPLQKRITLRRYDFKLDLGNNFLEVVQTYNNHPRGQNCIFTSWKRCVQSLEKGRANFISRTIFDQLKKERWRHITT